MKNYLLIKYQPHRNPSSVMTLVFINMIKKYGLPKVINGQTSIILWAFASSNLVAPCCLPIHILVKYE